MKSTRYVATMAVALAVFVGTVSCADGGEATEQDPDAPISVWVDDTRAAPAEEYASANDLNATIETIDNTAGSIPSRIALATKAGDAVPDVLFLSQPDEIATLLANPVNYPLGLTGEVDQEILDGFANGSVDRCTFGGVAYCFPNDIAQTVLYYNKTLFADFGYEVPATFDEWLDLGERVGREHPGYSLGSISTRYGLDAYFASSQCEYNTSTNPTEVTINVDDEKCTRVADVIAPLTANGTLSTLDPFDAAFTPVVTEGRLLATISPSWMGEYGIKPNFAEEGQFAVAPMPAWEGADQNYSGAVGGGIWVVSATSGNKEAAIAFATAMSTNVDIQRASSGFPADTASAKVWLEKVSSDAWYAEDPSDVLADAAGKITTTLGYVRYQAQLGDIYTATIAADASSGDLTAALRTFGEQATSAAEASGYTVSE